MLIYIIYCTKKVVNIIETYLEWDSTPVSRDKYNLEQYLDQRKRIHENAAVSQKRVRVIKKSTMPRDKKRVSRMLF